MAWYDVSGNTPRIHIAGSSRAVASTSFEGEMSTGCPVLSVAYGALGNAISAYWTADARF